MATAVKVTEKQRVSFTYQKRFRKFLIHLRKRENTLEDWTLLCSLNVFKFNVSSINTIPVIPAYTNSVLSENNYSMLILLNKQPVFQLSLRARVMLLLNLWAEVGLCNGAMGEVK